MKLSGLILTPVLILVATTSKTKIRYVCIDTKGMGKVYLHKTI